MSLKVSNRQPLRQLRPDNFNTNNQIIDTFCDNQITIFLLTTFCVMNRKKQPPRGVSRKKCSENMQQIYRRTLMLDCHFNKVAKQLY